MYEPLMQMPQAQHLAVKPVASGFLRVQKGSDDFNKLRFITEVSFTSTPAQTNTESYLDEGDIVETGEPGKPNWSSTLAVTDTAMAYRQLLDAFKNKSALNFEETSGKADKISNGADGIAIAKDTNKNQGTLTGSGNAISAGKLPTSFTAGRLIMMNNKAFSLEEKLSDTTFRVTYAGAVTGSGTKADPYVVALDSNPNTAFSAPVAGAWELHDYQVTTKWTGRVTDAGGTSRSGTTRNETVSGTCEDFPEKTFTLGT